MEVDMSIYLDGVVEKLLHTLTGVESPLRLEKLPGGSCMLLSKDDVLDSLFVYCPPDPETMEEQLHVKIQSALEFQPHACLYYQFNDPRPGEMRAMKKILDYVVKKGIAFYVTVEFEETTKVLVAGYNPKTETKIVDSGFSKKIPELFE